MLSLNEMTNEQIAEIAKATYRKMEDEEHEPKDNRANFFTGDK